MTVLALLDDQPFHGGNVTRNEPRRLHQAEAT